MDVRILGEDKSSRSIEHLRQEINPPIITLRSAGMYLEHVWAISLSTSDDPEEMLSLTRAMGCTDHEMDA